ncbi:unnamed protein product [Discosporangium mesarthrocarpum]
MEASLSRLTFSLQAALNLGEPPVALDLKVAQDEEEVICPLSVLIACPSYITSTFEGMTWEPLFPGGEGWKTRATTGRLQERDGKGQHQHHPHQHLRGRVCMERGTGLDAYRNLSMSPNPNLSVDVPDEDEIPIVGNHIASPSEGRGRPLTAPPGDRTPGGARFRPGRREGQGRPFSATPSDKCCGMKRIRPGKSEGFGRPLTALPSDHGSSPSPTKNTRLGDGSNLPADWFWCRKTDRPSSAPVLRVRRQLPSSCGWEGSVVRGKRQHKTDWRDMNLEPVRLRRGVHKIVHGPTAQVW